MAAIEITFTVLSSILLLYLLFGVFMHRRVPLVVELLYLCVYAVSAAFFFFPRFWDWLNTTLGVQLVLNLVIVLGLFLLFAANVRFYQKLEKMRQDITTLAREVALSEKKK